jgi:hypothetical protein
MFNATLTAVSLRGEARQMSDKFDKWIVIAGSVALAAVLSVGLLAWNLDDSYPMTMRTTLWFGDNRH